MAPVTIKEKLIGKGEGIIIQLSPVSHRVSSVFWKSAVIMTKIMLYCQRNF
jgi:hypothetical protein